MGTLYVDNVNGNDANSGASEVLAKATLSGAYLVASDDDLIYVQAAGSNYVLTSAVTTTRRLRWEGYTTVPGARDGRPTITSATDSVNLFEVGAIRNQFVHLKLTHTAATRGGGIWNTLAAGAAATDLLVDDCVIDGCSKALDIYFGYEGLAVIGSQILNCTDSTYAVIMPTAGSFVGTLFKGNAGANLYANFGNMDVCVDRCVFNGAARGVYYNANSGFQAVRFVVTRNTFYNQSSDAICIKEATYGARLVLTDNLFHTIGGYAVSSDCTTQAVNDRRRAERNNAFRSITSGNWNHFGAGFNDITLSADALTDPGSDDYSPNSTAGGGAALRAAGLYGADVGAVQHADAGGGSSGDFVYRRGGIFV